MDDADRAAERTARHNADCLAAHNSRTRPAGSGSDVCLRCGDTIPAERRRLAPSSVYCVDCQWEMENGA